MYTYEIDTSMLPKVWVSWPSKKNGQVVKRFWLNCETGEKKEVPESWMVYEGEDTLRSHSYRAGGRGICYRNTNECKVWVEAGSSVKYAYLKYHQDIEKFEVAIVGMDTSRKPEARTWQYIGDRYFVGKDKVVTDVNGNVKTRHFFGYKDHYYNDFKAYLSAMNRVHTNDFYTSEFRKFYGADSMTIRSGRVIEFDYPWRVWEWYVRTPITCTSIKRLQFIDSLTSMPLTDSSNFSERFKPVASHNGRWARTLDNVAYFERVDDNWSVIRGFYRRRNSESELREHWRLYIGDNGKLQMVAPSNGKWTPCAMSAYDGYHFVNKNEAMEKCKRIKYILTSWTPETEFEILPLLMRSLQYPEVEQMIKLGYTKIPKNNICSRTFKADMKRNFGGYYVDKEKNLLKKVGLTKPQLDYVMSLEARYYGYSFLTLMRSVLGDNLSCIDIESFKRYCRGFNTIYENCYGMQDAIGQIGVDSTRFYKNLIRLGEKTPTAYQVCRDTVRQYRWLDRDRKPRIDWYFDSYSDLVRAHDAVDELYRQQQAERQAYYNMQEAERRKKDEEKRIKLDKERVKYEYEEDEYIIRLPRDLTEIVNEGATQRICIGSYTQSHSNGTCTIFFLRKKSEESKPFYAIEMRDNKINQIHGYCNKWLGNNPEAIPTVMRWLRKNDIKCDTKILTCTSTGYSSNYQYIPLPQIN